MDSMIVAFFEQTALGMRLVRARRRWERGMVVVCVLLFVLPFVIIGRDFLFRLQTGIWSDYLFDIAPAMQGLTAPFIAARIVKSWPYEETYRASALRLRETARAEAESHQLAEVGPEREPVPATDGASRILRLGNPAPGQTALFALFGSLALLVGALCLAAAVVFPLAKGQGQLDLAAFLIWQVVLLALSAGVGLSLVVAAATTIPWLRRLHRAAWLEMDALGVRAVGHSPGDADALAWPEVQAFYLIGNRTYCLDSGERLLMWRVPVLRGDAGHARLVKMVAAYTGLGPEAIGSQVQAAYQKVARLPWSRGLRTLLITPIVAILVFLSGLWPIPQLQAQVQAWQFQPLVARIHAETPIFSDPLTIVDDNWTAPDLTGMTIKYSTSGVTLASAPDGYGADLQSNQVFQDAAVDVSIRTMGAMNPYDQVGLILRGNFGDRGAVGITLDQQGDWSASNMSLQTDPNEEIGQHDSTIRTGIGVWNTLLVLMRGQQYVIFINGQYAGVYDNDLVQSGPITLWDESQSVGGAEFANLKVYPAVYS